VFNHNTSIRENHQLYVRSRESGDSNTLLLSFGNISSPSWSHDERFIVFTEGSAGQADLWVVSTEGDQKKTAFLTTRHDEAAGSFSPNGKWIAYSSNASGRFEVYVRPFPVRPGERLVSREGGRAPRWRGDGKELFFLSVDGKMMVATIDPLTGNASIPQPLFFLPTRNTGARAYAVAKDGQRFLMLVPEPEVPLVTLLNGLPN
jgi:Tol biopolymer transport system component